MIQAQLCVDNAVGVAAIGAATRRWFVDGADQLGGELWRELLARPVPPADAEYRWEGAPGDVWAECGVDFGGGRAEWEGFSEDGWRKFLEATDGPSIVLASTLYRLTELTEGRLHPGHPRLALCARSIDLTTGGFSGLKVQLSKVDDQALLEYVRAAAAACPPLYGEISGDNGTYTDFTTSFEHATGRLPWQTVHTAARTLRGYSWLTIIDGRIGDRLGGVEALRGSGAFAEVDRFDHGAYWLLATPRLADYGPDEAVRVQRALAAALPPGRPRADLPGEAPHRLALVDAHPGRRPPPADHDDAFRNRLDPRDRPTHGCALAARVQTLRAAQPDRLIWATIGGEDGPHLICWADTEVWVWQCYPEDDLYAALDITRDLRPLLAAVAADPLTAGRPVRPGPRFEDLDLPFEETIVDRADSPAAQVTVFDGRPGVQLYYSDGRPSAADRARERAAFTTLHEARRAVIAARRAQNRPNA
jgi:hypothetical protein